MTVHLITVAGIPVYLHYCGGELEEISYVLKSNSCCGEGEDEQAMDDSCCQNESLVIRSDSDLLLKKIDEIKSSDFFPTLFLVKLSYLSFSYVSSFKPEVNQHLYPPPDNVQTSLIEATFLRI